MILIQVTRVHGDKWPIWINPASIHSMEFFQTDVYETGKEQKPKVVDCTKIRFGHGEVAFVKETVADIRVLLERILP